MLEPPVSFFLAQTHSWVGHVVWVPIAACLTLCSGTTLATVVGLKLSLVSPVGLSGDLSIDASCCQCLIVIPPSL